VQVTGTNSNPSDANAALDLMEKAGEGRDELKSLYATLVAILLLPLFCAAQNTPKGTSTSAEAQQEEDTGAIAFAQFQSSASRLGTVMNADFNLGYQLTPHVAVDIGLPVFFVRSPFSEVTTKDWRWTTLLGDIYLDARYATTRSGAKITSVLTGTIPVSSAVRVFSTGRPQVDWFNHVEKGYKQFTPFLNLGAGSGSVNRYLFPRPYSMARPYQTLGFVSDFEGGTDYQIRKGYKIGVSAYAIVPAGPQKMFSRLVAPDFALAGDAAHDRYFNNLFETIGKAKIGRDNGFSGWVEVAHFPHFTVQVGYTRSIHYANDTVTLMLNFNGSHLLREPVE
jgi:hypothetical protein